jgi:predicted RND superfamily exporter protein
MTAGFGLERLGLLTLKFPRATLVVAAVMIAIFAYGGSKVGFSSDIREIFRSGSPDFATLEEVARQYPGTDRDILIVAEADDLLTPGRVEALRNLHLELSLVDGVGSVLSMFSARYPPNAKGQAQSLFPVDLPPQSEMPKLRKELLAHPLVSGRLLSDDAKLSLIVVSLDRRYEDVEELRRLVDEVRRLADEMLAGQGVTTTLTGTAVMRVEIIGALIRDQQTFRIVGLSVAAILCWLFFRSLTYVIISLAPAGLAIMALKGGMGFAGEDINVLNNVISSLVMVIGFASALHLLFAMRRKRGRDIPVGEAIRDAVVEVGPACVLTSATTAIALLSLTLVPHPFIRSFGLSAAFGTGFAYVAIMMTVPPLARLLLGRNGGMGPGWGKAEPVHRVVDAVSAASATWVRQYPRRIAAVGIAAALVCGALYALNETHYQYQDNLPRGNPAFHAIEKINAKLSGTETVKLLIQWPQDAKPSDDRMLEVIRQAHAVLAKEPALKLVSSLHSVEDWYERGNRSNDDLFAFLKKSNVQLNRRLISTKYNSAIITGYFGNMPASEVVALIDRLNKGLEPLRERYAPITMALTGLVPVSAKASTEMIGQLNRSLLAAVAFIIVLIGLAYRSVGAGLVSILPNVLPIFVAGAALYISGYGLQFTSVVAFTIGFGIAVDSTIHVLNRYRLAMQEGMATPEALDLTIRTIGSVLIVSTLVLMAGIGGTILSELPMVSLYGRIIVLLLATALAGDLLFLPAIIRVVDDWKKARKGGGGAVAEKPVRKREQAEVLKTK